MYLSEDYLDFTILFFTANFISDQSLGIVNLMLVKWSWTWGYPFHKNMFKFQWVIDSEITLDIWPKNRVAYKNVCFQIYIELNLSFDLS